MDIFDSRQQRELQRLRQSQASSIVGIDPNLKGFTQRFDPDVSRMSLLKAQRERLPTKAELEKAAGIKTIKKLKKRKKKNLRGEVARNLREQRRFEKGERRDKPEQEPRIVGDPIPAVPGAAAPAAAADPNAQLRLAIEGRRIAAQDAQQRRLVDALMDRDDRERGERQAILDRQADERQALVGRSEVERQAILDREFAERREASGERDRILQGSERERVELRGAFRTILEGETAFARQERQDIRDQSEAERESVRREGREERTALRDRVDQQIIDERRKAAEERGQLFERGITALERFGDEERRERIQREDQQAAGQVAERQRERQQTEASAGRSQLERETILAAAAEERETLLRLSLESQRDPIPEGQTEADRNFISRQFQSGLDTIDRRIGEAEARTAEQIRQHADRVAAVEKQPPIIIQQPAPQPQPVQQGPTAAEIASSVRSQLQEIDTNRPVSPTARRINIEEQSEEETPVSSPRPIVTPQSTGQEIDFVGGGGEERGEPEPEVDLSGDEPVGSGELLRQGEFLEVGKRLLGGATSTKNTAINRFYGIDSSANPSVAAQVVGGGVVSEPAQVPSERIPELEQEEEEEEGTPSFGPRPVTPPRSFPPAIPTGDPEQKPREFAAPLAARPEGVAPLPPPELEGSGVFIDPSNLPQEGGQDLFQSGQFSGDLEAAAQNAIGFVGDIAGRAAGGISSLVNPDTPVGEQTGGGLVDAEGKPIFGLGQEIEPTIKPLASSSPRRRPKGESRSAPPRVETTGTTGRGLVEEEDEGEAEGVQPQLRRTNFQTYEALREDLDQSYVRGRPKGGSRDFVPFKVTNTSDRKFKGLEPGQSVSIAQVEGDGKLGYFPTGRVDKSKVGITRIGRPELEKQIKAGKLKIDRTGAE